MPSKSYEGVILVPSGVVLPPDAVWGAPEADEGPEANGPVAAAMSDGPVEVRDKELSSPADRRVPAIMSLVSSRVPDCREGSVLHTWRA